MKTIVTFIRLGREVRLQQVGTTYYIASLKRRKPISSQLAQ